MDHRFPPLRSQQQLDTSLEPRGFPTAFWINLGFGLTAALTLILAAL